jgi:hypothetical protein
MDTLNGIRSCRQIWGVYDVGGEIKELLHFEQGGGDALRNDIKK